MKLLFVADPLEVFKTYKDSTFAMMREAAVRRHELYVLQQEDLVWQAGTVTGYARKLQLTGDPVAWYRAEAAQPVPLKDFDAVLMRKDPPFDSEFFYATHLLEQAEREGARVFNSPRALRDHPEKLALMEFARFAPGLFFAVAHPSEVKANAPEVGPDDALAIVGDDDDRVAPGVRLDPGAQTL